MFATLPEHHFTFADRTVDRSCTCCPIVTFVQLFTVTKLLRSGLCVLFTHIQIAQKCMLINNIQLVNSVNTTKTVFRPKFKATLRNNHLNHITMRHCKKR